MANILLNDLFSLEVATFRGSAKGLDAPSYFSASTGDLSLPTIDAYKERLNRIWRIMVWTGAVVKKDADDMDAIAAKLKAADSSGN